MKRTLIIAMLLCAVAAIFLRQNDQPDPVSEPHQTDIPLSTAKSSTRRATPHEKNFWDEAIVPDPGESAPIKTIRPENLGIIPSANPPHPSILLSQAIEKGDAPAIHAATLAWFQLDPQAARDWIAQQESLDALQPAISYIAASIGETGDIPTAIEWVKILTDDTLRESTLFDIQALALRNRSITPDQIITDGLSPERVEELRSGAAGD